jgi:hypothetical protein
MVAVVSCSGLPARSQELQVSACLVSHEVRRFCFATDACPEVVVVYPVK